MPDPLSSPEAYQAFIYALPNRYASIQQSKLVYIPSGSLFGRLDGMLFFANKVMLCVMEILNFELQAIASYGYEVSRSHIDPATQDFPVASQFCQPSFQAKNKLYWYDSFPHPHIPALASTHPHHKHVHPDIKHNRIPAPNISFTRPNLPILIEEIENISETIRLSPE